MYAVLLTPACCTFPQLSQAQEELQDNNAELGDIDAAITELFESLSATPDSPESRTQLLDAAAEAAADMAKDLKKMKQELAVCNDQATKRIEQLQRDIDNARNKEEELTISVQEAKQSIEQKDIYAKEQRATIEDIQQKSLQLQSTIHSTQTERDSALQRVAELETELRQKSVEITTVQQKMEELNATIDELHEAAAKQSDALADGNAAVIRSTELDLVAQVPSMVSPHYYDRVFGKS